MDKINELETPEQKDRNKSAHIVIDVQQPEDEKTICFVCGHRNPKNTFMCEMCSNYLITQKTTIKQPRRD